MGSTHRDLRTIDPQSLQAYLGEIGLVQTKKWGASADVWSYDGLSIIVPNTRDREDYDEAIDDVLVKVGKLRGLSARSVFLEVLNFGYNRVDIRFATSGSSGGQLPFADFTDFMPLLKPIVRSTSWSVLVCRPMHLGSAPKEVEALLEQTKVGQTKPGSYVVPLYVPRDVKVQSETSKDHGFLSVEMMRSCIARLQTVAKQGRYDTEQVPKMAKDGVTTHVCDALVEMLSGQSDSRFGIGFRFTVFDALQSRPTSQESRHHLNVESVDVLRRLGESLRRRVNEANYTARGFVIGLKREDTSKDGQVTMVQRVGKEMKRLTFSAHPAMYDQITEAHREGLEIKVKGTLNLERGRSKLLDPHGFAVLEEPNDPVGELDSYITGEQGIL